jgi:hypothetical protein
MTKFNSKEIANKKMEELFDWHDLDDPDYGEHRQDIHEVVNTVLKEFIKKQEGRFNKLADNLPQESNHNFNRSSIKGMIKNEVLLMKKDAGE